MKHKTSILTIFLFLCLFSNFVFAYDDLKDSDQIRVGVFQNKPVVYHEDNQGKGLYPMIIEYIADHEGWNIEYVICGFAECLELMKDGKVDIMTSIVDTPERREFFEFSEAPVWDYYGIIFSHDAGITGLFDLEGKVIGGRKASVYTLELQKILKSFNIKATFKPYHDYDKVFDDLNINLIDVAAVNNTFSYTKRDLGHVYQTPIVYSPFSSVWAAPKGSMHVPKLKIIDKYIIDLKNDKTSVYYQFKEHWFAKYSVYWTTRRMLLFIGLPVAIIMFFMITYHYSRTIAMNIKMRRTLQAKSRAESDAEEQRVFATAIIDSLPGIFYVYDSDGKLLQWNANHATATGYTDKEMDSMTIDKWYDPGEDWDYIQEEFAILLGSEPGTVVETRPVYLKYKDGSKIPYRFITTLFNWNGKILVIGVGFDVSENIAAQKEKEKLKSRLEQAQKMEAIGTLAGGIAHDFNNVLTVILGYSEAIQADIDDFRKESNSELNTKRCDMVDNNINIVLDAADKAKNLIHQILAFSRQGKANRIKLDVVEALNNSIVMIRQTLPTTIDIKTNISPDVGNIYADTTQFQQIIMNLCINSFHAMEENGGILSVALHKVTLDSDDLLYEDDVQAGNFAKISIRDTGCGIPDSIKDKIFNPYFTTKPVNKGTGMGLSIVHGIIKQYGGFIHLYSEKDQGTVFNLFIPMYNGESQISHTTPIYNLNGTEKILIVDDEPLIANVNKMLLENFGYRVDIQINSVEALTIFKDNPDEYDLVITDQTMPTMTGFDMSMKMLEIRPDIPIILCSGYSSILSDKKIRESGIREFALKPILKNDLAKLIRKILG